VTTFNAGAGLVTLTGTINLGAYTFNNLTITTNTVTLTGGITAAALIITAPGVLTIGAQPLGAASITGTGDADQRGGGCNHRHGQTSR